MRANRVKVVARLGYAARGLVYLLIGGLAFLAAIGSGGQTTDSKGALASLLGQPLGFVIIVAIGLGLFAYAAWRAVQGLLDADHHGTGARGLAIRGAMCVSAVTHASLGLYAVTLPFALGAFSKSDGDGSRDAAAWILRQPFGRYLLALVAIAIIGAGLAQIWRGLGGSFRRHLAMRESLLEKLAPVCAFGLAARGVVFLVIGGFFAYAAWVLDPDRAGGIARALQWLRSQPYGSWLFLAVAIGLVAFGLYGIIQAIWRRIDLDGAFRRASRLGAAGNPF